MDLIKAFFIILLTSMPIKTCPTAKDMQDLHLNYINQGFIFYYTLYLQSHSEQENNISDYCRDEIWPLISKLNEVNFKHYYPKADELVVPNPHWSGSELKLWYGLKICYNLHGINLENINKLRTQSPRTADNQPHLSLLIEQLINSNETIILKLATGNDKYAVKFDLSDKNLLYYENEVARQLYDQSSQKLHAKSIVKPSLIFSAPSYMLYYNMFVKSKAPKAPKDPKDAFIDICLYSPLDFDESSKTLVMEFGGDTYWKYLSSIMQSQGTVEYKARLTHYERFAELLSVLNDKDILYCDFKPENVVFNPDNLDKVKLIDLGSVKFGKQPCTTQTILYSPPEMSNTRLLLEKLEEENFTKIKEILKSVEESGDTTLLPDNQIEKMLMEEFLNPSEPYGFYNPSHDVYTLGVTIFVVELLLNSQQMEEYIQNPTDMTLKGLVGKNNEAHPGDMINVFDYFRLYFTWYKTYQPKSWKDFYQTELTTYPNSNRFAEVMKKIIEDVSKVNPDSARLLDFVFNNAMCIKPKDRINMKSFKEQLAALKGQKSFLI